MTLGARAPFDAPAFVAEYRALGGDLVVIQAGAGVVEWFGVINPPSGHASLRAAAMRAELVADRRKEDALAAHLLRAI